MWGSIEEETAGSAVRSSGFFEPVRDGSICTGLQRVDLYALPVYPLAGQGDLETVAGILIVFQGYGCMKMDFAMAGVDHQPLESNRVMP